MGFSAGGHLASTAATHFDAGRPDAADPIDRQSCRPDFAILAYPVITMTGKFGHSGSKKNLLGENPDPQLAESLSNEKQVTPETPPTFLFHTSEDTGGPRRKQRAFLSGPASSGRAGRNAYLRERPPRYREWGQRIPKLAWALGTWPARLHDWMQLRGLLARRKSRRPASVFFESQTSKTECARKRLAALPGT